MCNLTMCISIHIHTNIIWTSRVRGKSFCKNSLYLYSGVLRKVRNHLIVWNWNRTHCHFCMRTKREFLVPYYTRVISPSIQKPLTPPQMVNLALCLQPLAEQTLGFSSLLKPINCCTFHLRTVGAVSDLGGERVPFVTSQWAEISIAFVIFASEINFSGVCRKTGVLVAFETKRYAE